MREHQLTLVGCEEGDWHGIYVDGKLHNQNHSLNARLFSEIISKYQYFERLIEKMTLSSKQMDELGGILPYKFEHILEIVK